LRSYVTIENFEMSAMCVSDMDPALVGARCQC
jgi:hypothetical protein